MRYIDMMFYVIWIIEVSGFFIYSAFFGFEKTLFFFVFLSSLVVTYGGLLYLSDKIIERKNKGIKVKRNEMIFHNTVCMDMEYAYLFVREKGLADELRKFAINQIKQGHHFEKKYLDKPEKVE